MIAPSVGILHWLPAIEHPDLLAAPVRADLPPDAWVAA